VSKKQFLGVTLSLSLLGIVLSSLLIRAQHPVPVNPDLVAALWIAQSDGIRKVATADASDLLHIDDLKHVKAIAVDDQRGVLWAYIQNTLWAYHSNGEPAFSLLLAAHGDHGNHPHVALSVNAANGTVWLGAKKTLFHIGTQGEWLSVHTLSEPVQALSWGPSTACLWVGTQKTAYALNDTGGLCRRLDLGAHPDVQDLAVDPDSGDIWVALKKVLRRYDASGTLALEVELGKVSALANDHRGGVWIAADKRLMRLDRTGVVLLEVDPFNKPDKIVALVADPSDSSVWVAGKKQISHLRSDGHPLHQLTWKGEIQDLALYADLTPPGLALTAPRDGSTLTTNAPTIEMEYHDSGSGVDVETLRVRANDADMPTSCQFSETGAACTPTTGLPEGVVTLTAAIQDYAGNLAEADDIRVTIDSAAPVITLISPLDGAVTNQALQSFVGSLSEVSTLTLNGMAVQVGANLGFNHGPISLQQGLNVFALVATDAVGHSSHRTVQITLDTAPPAPIENTSVQVSDVSEGQVQVSGQVGSVEAGASVTVTNTRTGQMVTVQA
jgi:hypothetical protein